MLLVVVLAKNIAINGGGTAASGDKTLKIAAVGNAASCSNRKYCYCC